MKSITLFAACGLLTSSALAGQTSFTVGNSQVKARIEIASNENPNAVSPLAGFAPGERYTGLMTIENHTLASVELILPFLGTRYPVNGVSTQLRPWAFASSIVIAAGATYRQTLQGFIPRDADVGSRFKVGMVIGMQGHADDLRAVYSSALVVRGVTDNSGGQVGTVNGSGPLIGRRLGGNGGSTNTAPQPRTDPEPGLPTRRRR